MTIAYKFTKCKSITFAKDDKYLDEFSLPVITIDETTKNFNDITNCKDTEVIIKIKLGMKTKGKFLVPINVDELITKNDTLTEFEDDDSLIDLINQVLKTDVKKIDDKQAGWLIEHFNLFTSHKCQQYIVDLLNEHKIHHTLEPIPGTEEQEHTIVTTIPLFSDIRIVDNDRDPNATNKNYVKGKLTEDSIRNSTQLEAFGKNKFTVIHGRKQANIPNSIRNRNYGVIDSLARNGVICSPETKNKLSIEILVDKLSKLDAFHIVIIHPSYTLKYNSSTYPGESIEPNYKLNEGEILAVFYRYICIHFFGYCEIHGENDLEWKYNI